MASTIFNYRQCSPPRHLQIPFTHLLFYFEICSILATLSINNNQKLYHCCIVARENVATSQEDNIELATAQFRTAYTEECPTCLIDQRQNYGGKENLTPHRGNHYINRTEETEDDRMEEGLENVRRINKHLQEITLEHEDVIWQKGKPYLPPPPTPQGGNHYINRTEEVTETSLNIEILHEVL